MPSPILVLSSLFIVGLIGAIFVRDMIVRKRDLFTVRNFFLLGVFFFYGVAGVIYGLNPAGFPYVSRGEGMAMVALALPVFMIVFFLGEVLGRRMSGLSRLIPPANFPVTSPSLLLSIIVTLGFGVLVLAATRSQTGGMGYGSALALQFRNGMAACAMGLATYYFVARKFNPIAWATFAGTFVVASVITTYGGTGRRDWLAVFFAVPWTWYYATLRYRPLLPLAIKLAPVGAVTLVIMISYSTIRHDYGKEVSYNQRIGQLMDLAKNPLGGLGDSVKVMTPDTTSISSFIFEVYPASYERKPLNGLFYVLAQPIPRGLWSGKPNALGVDVQDHLNSPANLGPGVIGHGWAEAGWLGVVYYGLFFGVFVVIVDAALIRRAEMPFFVAVIGAALGNVLALPRGDTPLFFTQIMATWISTLVLLYLIRYAAGALMTGFPSIAVLPPVDGDSHEDEWPEYTDEDEYQDEVPVL